MQTDWEIIEQLGKNKQRKFGDVFILKDKADNNLYILKSAKKDHVTPRALLQLKNESQFSFENIELPQVIYFKDLDNCFELLLNYKKGIPLDEYWKTISKKTRLAFTKKLVQKTVSLLTHIHQQAIFHCDIKPSNILIEQQGDDFSIHLIDFGMAIDKKNKSTVEKELIFPLGFAAPELILNKSKFIDNTTDYFALGITIYQLWTGKLPLSHPNPSIFTNLQLAHPIPYNSEMPKQLNQWIAKVCTKPTWRTAPNLMSDDEIETTLENSINQRIKDPTIVIEELQKVTSKRSWFW